MKNKKLIMTPWGPAHKTNQIATGLYDWWTPQVDHTGTSGWWVSAKRLTQMPDFTQTGTPDRDEDAGPLSHVYGMWFDEGRWILPCLAFLPEVKRSGPQWWPAYRHLIEQILNYEDGPIGWMGARSHAWCLSKLEKDN